MKNITFTLPNIEEYFNWLNTLPIDVANRLDLNKGYKPNKTSSAIAKWFRVTEPNSAKRYVLHLENEDIYLNPGDIQTVEFYN